MARRWRTIVRLVIVSLLFVPAASFTPASHDHPGELCGELRLRKLHLVRPDLIPYPIVYDVFC